MQIVGFPMRRLICNEQIFQYSHREFYQGLVRNNKITTIWIRFINEELNGKNLTIAFLFWSGILVSLKGNKERINDFYYSFVGHILHSLAKTVSNLHFEPSHRYFVT